MGISIHIVSIILRLVDILLHSSGIYLLLSCDRHEKCSVQQLYITNLSVTEICFSVLWLFMIPVSDLFTTSDSVSAIIKHVQHYVMVCIYTTVVFVFYATMIYITLDRLVAIKLSLKYRIYWNTKRAKYLILGTWVAGSLLFLSILLLNESTGFKFDIEFHKYFYTPLNILFIILAVFTYIFIFREYKKSVDMNSSRQNSIFIVFYKSQFYISVLLILTFLLFIIIPDLTYLFDMSIQNKKSKTLLSACAILYSIANIMNGCLYIFLQPNIKGQLWKKFHIRKTGCYTIAKVTTKMFWIVDNEGDITP